MEEKMQNIVVKITKRMCYGDKVKTFIRVNNQTMNSWREFGFVHTDWLSVSDVIGLLKEHGVDIKTITEKEWKDNSYWNDFCKYCQKSFSMECKDGLEEVISWITFKYGCVYIHQKCGRYSWRARRVCDKWWKDDADFYIRKFIRNFDEKFQNPEEFNKKWQNGTAPLANITMKEIVSKAKKAA